MESTERWVKVQDWPEYEVSDLGRVRSVTRVSYHAPSAKREGQRCTYRGKILSATPLKNGYRAVDFTRSGLRERHYVHALVLAAFVGPRPEGKECCHNDGVRLNNTLTNLRYDTRSANSHDRKAHGTVAVLVGSASPSSKLTESEVLFVRTHRSALSLDQWARAFQVHPTTISQLLTGNTWKHVAFPSTH